MKRVLSIIGVIVLLFSITAQDASGHYSFRRHWHYIDSFTTLGDILGTWQVTTYYHVRINGWSPGYSPSVVTTEPMECRVPYSYLSSNVITVCRLDRLTQYNPDRWRVTTRWKQCVYDISWFCVTHGMNLTFTATGRIYDRSKW